MSVRWRLGVAAIQLFVLLLGSRIITDTWIPADPWFASGILLVVLSSQLTEPFYGRPVDSLVGCITALVLVFTSERDVVPFAWLTLAWYLAVGVVVSVLALTLGASRSHGPGVALGRSASQLVGLWKGRNIFAALFVLSSYEVYGGQSNTFMQLLILGAVVLAIGSVRWQAIVQTATGKVDPGTVVGVLSPSRLLMSLPDAPSLGQPVHIKTAAGSADGFVVSRTRRSSDYWCEIEVGGAEIAEPLVGKTVTVTLVNIQLLR